MFTCISFHYYCIKNLVSKLIFSFIGTKNYSIFSSWTINEYAPNGEVQWHGLFNVCDRTQCTMSYNRNFSVILCTIVGALFLLGAAFCIFLMGVHSFPRRHFYLTPLVAFIAVLLLFAALVLYARWSLLNGISARLMITAMMLALTSLAIVVFVAGRYSIFYKANPADFQYSKAENNDSVKRVAEQYPMQAETN